MDNLSTFAQVGIFSGIALLLPSSVIRDVKRLFGDQVKWSAKSQFSGRCDQKAVLFPLRRSTVLRATGASWRAGPTMLPWIEPRLCSRSMPLKAVEEHSQLLV